MCCMTSLAKPSAACRCFDWMCCACRSIRRAPLAGLLSAVGDDVYHRYRYGAALLHRAIRHDRLPADHVGQRLRALARRGLERPALPGTAVGGAGRAPRAMVVPALWRALKLVSGGE